MTNLIPKATDLQEFQEQGFVHVLKFLEKSVLKETREEATKLASREGILKDLSWPAPREDRQGQPIQDRIEPVSTASVHFRHLSQSPLFKSTAERFLGEESKLFKEKLILKPPGTSGYLPHQDYRYWEQLEIPAGDFFTIFVALDDMDAENGALELFPGTHRERLPSGSGDPRDIDPAILAQLPSKLIECRAGDAIIFHSLTAHRSGVNLSQRHRRVWISSWCTAKHGNLYRRMYGVDPG